VGFTHISVTKQYIRVPLHMKVLICVEFIFSYEYSVSPWNVTEIRTDKGQYY
jgi:hypothetical protein